MRTLLIVAIVSLIGYHLFRLSSLEKFADGADPLVNDGSRISARFRELDIAELERPSPYRPVDPDGVVSFLKNTVPTPYLNQKPPNLQESVSSEDNPLDLPWIASWSAADRKARGGQNCIALSSIEWDEDTHLEIVSKSCEAGMPHTRAGDRIVIPDSIPVALHADIIDHEMVHIWQRRRPKEWADFYQRNWSFVFHKEPASTMPAWMRNAKRSNPDTFQTGWPCWKGRFWPVPVYTNMEDPNLRDAKTVWWDEWQHRTLTEAPAEWKLFFGQPDQNEHPHEIAAVMIATGSNGSDAGRRLMDWWRSEGLLMRMPRYLNILE